MTPATELFPRTRLCLLFHPTQHKIKNFPGFLQWSMRPYQSFCIAFLQFNKRLNLASVLFNELKVTEIGSFLI